MRTAAVILVALAAAVIAATARAEATFTEHPRLTRAAGAVPGQVTETGAPGPARVYCWNEEAWRSAGWGGEADGFYDGFTELRWYICRPLLRSLRGWQPRLPERRWWLGYAAFVLGHEAAHAAGAGHESTEECPRPTVSPRVTSAVFSAGWARRAARRVA